MFLSPPLEGTLPPPPFRALAPSPRTAQAAPRAHHRTGARARDRRWGPEHVLDRHLFAEALRRERGRAERFDQSFLLLLVELQKGAGPASIAAAAHVPAALAAAKRDMDVLGWLDRGSVVGLLVPEIDAADSAIRDEVETRVRRELAARLGAEGAAGCAITLQMHSGAHAAASAGHPIGDAARSGALDVVRDSIKRALDVAGSLALLVLLSPLFLMLAVLVKLTSAGPVFFRQERVGQTSKPFTMLKFRTMRVNADEGIHRQYVAQFIDAAAPAARSGTTPVFKIVDDPRVTPAGHFLRRTSLDELPQFWNVLRGEMSLVGPRPPLPYEVQRYKRWHRRRVLEAKPGITGLWQVTGRSSTTFDEMVRLDLQYARTRSLWQDIRILLATPRAVISGKGAC